MTKTGAVLLHSHRFPFGFFYRKKLGKSTFICNNKNTRRTGLRRRLQNTRDKRIGHTLRVVGPLLPIFVRHPARNAGNSSSVEHENLENAEHRSCSKRALESRLHQTSTRTIQENTDGSKSDPCAPQGISEIVWVADEGPGRVSGNCGNLQLRTRTTSPCHRFFLYSWGPS